MYIFSLCIILWFSSLILCSSMLVFNVWTCIHYGHVRVISELDKVILCFCDVLYVFYSIISVLFFLLTIFGYNICFPTLLVWPQSLHLVFCFQKYINKFSIFFLFAVYLQSRYRNRKKMMLLHWTALKKKKILLLFKLWLNYWIGRSDVFCRKINRVFCIQFTRYIFFYCQIYVSFYMKIQFHFWTVLGLGSSQCQYLVQDQWSKILVFLWNDLT